MCVVSFKIYFVEQKCSFGCLSPTRYLTSKRFSRSGEAKLRTFGDSESDKTSGTRVPTGRFLSVKANNLQIETLAN